MVDIDDREYSQFLVGSVAIRRGTAALIQNFEYQVMNARIFLCKHGNDLQISHPKMTQIKLWDYQRAK